MRLILGLIIILTIMSGFFAGLQESMHTVEVLISQEAPSYSDGPIVSANGHDDNCETDECHDSTGHCLHYCSGIHSLIRPYLSDKLKFTAFLNEKLDFLSLNSLYLNPYSQRTKEPPIFI